jgi:hypothetical protein
MLMPFLERLDADDEELVNVWKYQTALLASGEGMFQLSSCSELTCLNIQGPSLPGLLQQ